MSRKNPDKIQKVNGMTDVMRGYKESNCTSIPLKEQSYRNMDNWYIVENQKI